MLIDFSNEVANLGFLSLMIVVPCMMLSVPVLELLCVVCQCFLLAEAFHFPLQKVTWLVFKFHMFSSNMSYQFYRFHAIIVGTPCH
jgi:hypothetical protein